MLWKFNTLGFFEWKNFRIEKGGDSEYPYRLHVTKTFKTFEDAEKEVERLSNEHAAS